MYIQYTICVHVYSCHLVWEKDDERYAVCHRCSVHTFLDWKDGYCAQAWASKSYASCIPRDRCDRPGLASPFATKSYAFSLFPTSILLVSLHTSLVDKVTKCMMLFFGEKNTHVHTVCTLFWGGGAWYEASQHTATSTSLYVVGNVSMHVYIHLFFCCTFVSVQSFLESTDSLNKKGVLWKYLSLCIHATTIINVHQNVHKQVWSNLRSLLHSVKFGKACLTSL